MSETTGSYACLSSWEPHVTLGDGVEVDEHGYKGLVEDIEQVAHLHPVFELEISGFSSLDNRPLGVGEASTPYAIFIDVHANNLLQALVAGLQKITSEHPIWYHMPQPYLPHVTLAFRDLSREGFDRGIAYLSDKDIRITSVIDHISLVEKLETKDIERKRILLKP